MFEPASCRVVDVERDGASLPQAEGYGAAETAGETGLQLEGAGGLGTN